MERFGLTGEGVVDFACLGIFSSCFDFMFQHLLFLIETDRKEGGVNLLLKNLALDKIFV